MTEMMEVTGQSEAPPYDAEVRSRLSKGIQSWNDWRAQHPEAVVNLRGVNLAGENLIGANLQGANLSGADLSGATLIGANLSQATLNHANLSRASIGGAILEQALLRKANLSQANLFASVLREANLSEADLSRASLIDANLSGAILVRANLRQAKLGGANLSSANLCDADLNEANLNNAALGNAGLWGVKWHRHTMRGHYHGIHGLETCLGNPLFKKDASDQCYLDALEHHWQGSWPKEMLFYAWGLIDYGRSLLRVAAIAVALMVLFGSIYKLFPEMLNVDNSAHTWFTPYYFSIVTYTTLGFGDVRPASLGGEIMVSIEVLFGYMTLGLLLSVLAEKVARRT